MDIPIDSPLLNAMIKVQQNREKTMGQLKWTKVNGKAQANHKCGAKATRVGPIDEDGNELWTCENGHNWIEQS